MEEISRVQEEAADKIPGGLLFTYINTTYVAKRQTAKSAKLMLIKSSSYVGDPVDPLRYRKKEGNNVQMPILASYCQLVLE